MERRARAGRCATALAAHGPLDLRSLIAQALQMGDEGHNRNRAATSLLIRALAPHLVRARRDRGRRRRASCASSTATTTSSSTSRCRPASASLDAGGGHRRLLAWSRVMARNGTDFGIQVSALPGPLVHRARADGATGSTSPASRAADAAPDIGDSVITETAGLGGFAMAAAPAIVQFVGGSAAQDASATPAACTTSRSAEHPAYQIPALDFRGTPTGIDLLKVVETRHPARRQHRHRPPRARHRHGRRRPRQAALRVLPRRRCSPSPSHARRAGGPRA